MSYSSKKAELLNQSSRLLKSYSAFYKEVLKFSNDLQKFIDGSSNFSAFDQLDLAKLVVSDEEIKKINRLICALEFVEHPDDKGIAFRLQDQIDKCINQIYTK